MERRHELQQRPELKQYLLPTLVYYLKLIELPNLELETYLHHELETNPLLEESSSESSGEPEDSEEKSEEQDQLSEADLNILELFSQDTYINYGAKEMDFDPFDNVAARDEKLYDVLMRQARCTFSGEDMEIAEHIIANVEEDGFLAATPEELAGTDYDPGQIQSIIARIQRFDPVGCCWRDPREPLLIQLEDADFSPDSVEYIIVRDYLKELRSNHINDIINKLQIDEARFEKAKSTILKLDPRPGWRYSSAPSRYITPDFIVYWNDDQLCACLNDETTPRVRVRRQYLEMVRRRAKVPKEDLDFVRQRVNSAQNLIMAIEQRRRTLNRIINGILEYQHEFFEKGYNHLKPMTMTEFARQLNVNPSTISRALAHKYLESPWGIHRMKFFFTAAVGDTDKRIILQKIKEIIDSEDKTSPLSDTQIVKKLSRLGIIISRRTISKYRDLLGIPAHQFRRET
jgi:RNA polymerase sigma-54 factor